jgi:hypothetical protein
VCLLSKTDKKVYYTASDCSLMPSERLVLAISWQEQVTLVLSQHAYLDFI